MIKIKVSDITVYGLLFGFTFNAYMQYCFGPARMIFISLFLIGIFLTLKNDISRSYNIKIYIFLYIFILLSLLSLSSSGMPKIIAIKELYTNVSIVLGFFAYRYYGKFKRVLLILIFLNFLVMLYDIYSGHYLFNLISGNYYQADRGEGLFSYSKETGVFLIFSALIFHNYKFTTLIIFLSSVMSGSRSQ